LSAEVCAPIRVLHLGSATGIYGAERWILALAKHLPRTGVESWVAVIKDDPALEAPLCHEAARLGLHAHVFESHGKLSVSAIGMLRRFVKTNAIDILHTHGYKTDIIGRLAVTGMSCRMLSTPHGWSVNSGLKVRLYEALDRLVFPLFDAVVPLSTELHTQLARWPGLRKRLYLITNGVDLSELEPSAEMPPNIARKGADVVIGYIGRLITLKRVDTLIRAFHKLPIPNRRLWLIGDGPERPRLEQLAADLGESERCTFWGYRTDRIALLQGLDVFVLPSQSEGTPRCVMEAMAAGVPVITSDIVGCRALIQPGVTGLLFSPGDDTSLAQQMSCLSSDSALRARLARTARQRVRDLYSAEAMAQSYLALYERLMQAGAGLRQSSEGA
jgi:glycosyltransferase involved in cell wall biosynthesis